MRRWLAAALLAAGPAIAGEREAQIAGLFAQACVVHAGDAAGLRAWIDAAGLPPLSPKGQAAFVVGSPGVAYDATNRAGGKLVVIAYAGGGCAVAAPAADQPALAGALAGDLARLGISPDAASRDPSQTFRSVDGARAWRLTTLTADDPAAPIVMSAERLR